MKRTINQKTSAILDEQLQIILWGGQIFREMEGRYAT